MDEKDLEKLNELDLDFDGPIDDSDSFSQIKDDNKVVKTGVIINLSDDDNYKFEDNLIEEPKEETFITKHNDFKNEDPEIWNEIDMSCEYGDDEDFIEDNAEPEELVFDNELVLEDVLDEKKKVNQDQIEKDYWKKVQQKHLKSNKKGAYNVHFHLAGNPKKEQDMFNHIMSPETHEAPSDYDYSVLGNTDVVSNDVSVGEVSGDFGGGDAGGCSESLTESLKDVLAVVGFELEECEDNCYNLKDTIENDSCYDKISKEDVFSILKPYIDTYFLVPVELHSQKTFKNYDDCIAWYDNEKDEKFNNCKDDVNYIKLFVKAFK